MSPMPRTPPAVRASISARINAYAEAHGQNPNMVRRRFVMSRFLARVFAVDPDGWILKGGVGMMVRLPEARYSKDIDIISIGAEDPVDELRRIVRDTHLDHFRFEVGHPRALSGGKGSSVPVIARIANSEFDSFSLDIVDSRRELVGQVERHPLPLLVETDDFLPHETDVQLYPLADQIADKICAMYETYGRGGAPSGRFRDLVDLLLISLFLPIDLASTVTAVERERTLREIPALPEVLESPGPQWPTQWKSTASKSPLSANYHEFDVALDAARRCYNRILSSLPTAGTAAIWHHGEGIWTDT